MTVSVRCLDCKRFSFKTAGAEHARNGYGNCADHATFILYGAMSGRDCGKFEKADAETIEGREAFMRGRK